MDCGVTEPNQILLFSLYNIFVTAVNLHHCSLRDHALNVPLLKEQFPRSVLSCSKMLSITHSAAYNTESNS